jgi:predicted transposase/invertase (TIGR01784 family)
MPFKKTFANEKEKEPVIVMLNVCLGKKLAHPIVNVHIKNPYVPGQTLEHRDSVFDIRCEDTQGNQFIVEVQVGRQAYFIKRVLYYACMTITDSGKKGDWDFNYPPVYTLSFLSFDLDFKNDDIVQYLSISNDNHPEIRYDYLNMVFVRLTKFDKTEDECQTLQDRLFFSLCHAHKLREKPAQFTEGVFDKIFGIAKISRFTPSERSEYEAAMKNALDTYAALKCARDEGRDEGREAGITIGEARGRQEARDELFSLWESGLSLAEAKQKLQP